MLYDVISRGSVGEIILLLLLIITMIIIIIIIYPIHNNLSYAQ